MAFAFKCPPRNRSEIRSRMKRAVAASTLKIVWDFLGKAISKKTFSKLVPFFLVFFLIYLIFQTFILLWRGTVGRKCLKDHTCMRKRMLPFIFCNKGRPWSPSTEASSLLHLVLHTCVGVPLSIKWSKTIFLLKKANIWPTSPCKTTEPPYCQPTCT